MHSFKPQWVGARALERESIKRILLNNRHCKYNSRVYPLSLPITNVVVIKRRLRTDVMAAASEKPKMEQRLCLGNKIQTLLAILD